MNTADNVLREAKVTAIKMEWEDPTYSWRRKPKWEYGILKSIT